MVDHAEHVASLQRTIKGRAGDPLDQLAAVHRFALRVEQEGVALNLSRFRVNRGPCLETSVFLIHRNFYYLFNYYRLVVLRRSSYP